MNNWGNRVQERKNGQERQEYHIKTRQYAKAEPYSREDKNQVQTEKEKMGRLDKYDRIDKYDKYEKLQKREDYSKSPFNKDYHQASFNESNKLADVSINTQNCQKKENARNKGFEMRVNNIDNIHDKITNLLNLVKKDAKSICSSNSKIKDNYGESTHQDLSPKAGWKDKLKRIPTPTYGAKENQIVGDQKYKVNKVEGSKKDYPRARTNSVLNLERPKQKGNDFMQTKNKYQYSNEQDKNDEAVYSYGDLQIKKYKPAFKRQEKQKQKEDRLKLNETSLLVSNRERFNYNNNISPKAENNQAEKRIERMVKERKKDQQYQRLKAMEARQNLEEPNSLVGKWNKYYETENQQSPINSCKYQRPPSKSKNAEPSIMPMTLLCNNANERAEAVTGTTRMIDEQIKRIKSKIQESESHNFRMQQRLNVNQNDTTTGKRNTTNRPETANRFQLKLHPVEIDKEQTVRIAEMLSSQAEIDNQMRVAREKFNSNKDESRWKELEHNLKTRGMKITIGQIKELLTLSPEEHNPFGDGQSGTPRNNNIIDLFCEAQQHWENKVCGCSSLKLLKAEGFEAGEMDLSKKGFLQVEDLVCFINLYTGHFYRNRDIMLIYRRLQLLEANKSKQGVQYSTFMRTIAL